MGFNGNVDDLQGSCNGPGACYEMAKYGSVGNLEDSCNVDRACFKMGFKGLNIVRGRGGG